MAIRFQETSSLPSRASCCPAKTPRYTAIAVRITGFATVALPLCATIAKVNASYRVFSTQTYLKPTLDTENLCQKSARRKSFSVRLSARLTCFRRRKEFLKSGILGKTQKSPDSHG